MRFSFRRLLGLLAVFTVIGLLAGLAPGASAGGRGAQSLPSDEPRRGLVYDGLHRALTGPCSGEFSIETRSGQTFCTHGPDPAPAGVDVTAHRSLADLAPDPSRPSTVPCVGNGTSGNRVQVIYAHASDVTSRLSSLEASIKQWAADVETTFEESSGGARQVRWVTNATAPCEVTVLEVTLPTTGDDDFNQTISALQTQGFTSPHRKYLVWMERDPNPSIYCGIATIFFDDRNITQNKNNGLMSGYGRIDPQCWGLFDPSSNSGAVEAHELMHNLGAVQLTAPNATKPDPQFPNETGGHCFDESDLMCYDDDNDPNSFPLQQICPPDQEPYFDCGDDDYFNTNPVAPNYLADHWNAAMNSFLAGLGVFPPGVPQHGRAISAKVKTTPTAFLMKGTLITVDGFAPCSNAQKIRGQKKKGSRWVTLFTKTTGSTGGFKLPFPKKVGKYRGLAPQSTASGETCLKAVSGTLTVH